MDQGQVGLILIGDSQIIQVIAKHDLGLGGDGIAVLVKGAVFVDPDMGAGDGFGFCILAFVPVALFGNDDTVLTGGGTVCQLGRRLIKIVTAIGEIGFGLGCGTAIVCATVNADTVFRTGGSGASLCNVLPVVRHGSQSDLFRMIAIRTSTGEDHGRAFHTGGFVSRSHTKEVTERIGDVIDQTLSATLAVIFGVSTLRTGGSGDLRVVVVTVKLTGIGRGSKTGQIRGEVGGFKGYKAAVLGLVVGCRIEAQLAFVVDIPNGNAIGVGICGQLVGKGDGDSSVTELGNGNTALRKTKVINGRTCGELVAD